MRTIHLEGLTLVLVVATVFACRVDLAEPINRSDSFPLEASQQSDERIAALELVARGLVSVMSQRNARVVIADAMRRSPWVGHKLDLGAFLETPLGSVIADSLASKVGLSRVELHSRLNALGPLDFVMPSVKSRSEWSSDSTALVAARVNRDSEFRVFEANGELTVVRPGQGVPSRVRSMFLVRPAGRRIKRVGGVTVQASSGIQGSTESDFGVAYLRPRLDGSIEQVDLADIQDGPMRDGEFCDPSGCTSGGTSEQPVAVSLTLLKLYDVDDGLSGGSATEWKFKSDNYPEDFPTTIIEGGFVANSTHEYPLGAVPIVPSWTFVQGTQLFVTVQEEDGWPDPDDDWWISTDRYVPPGLHTFGVANQVGNNHCVWQMAEDKNWNMGIRAKFRFSWTPLPQGLLLCDAPAVPNP